MSSIMKFCLSLSCICVFALILLTTSCKESNPYDAFKGAWVYTLMPQEKGLDFIILSLEPDLKIITMIISKNEKKEIYELPIKEMETRDGLLAVVIKNSSLLPDNLKFQSLFFESLDSDSLLLKICNQPIETKNLLDQSTPKPSVVVQT